jgi:hypothetical protein
VAKKNPEIASFLPDKISFMGMKSKIETRQDFNRELNSLKRFSKKGSEKVQTYDSGLTKTNWEVREGKRKNAINEARKTRQRKKAGFSLAKGTMGSVEENSLKPKVLNPNKKSPKDWEKAMQVLDKAIMSNFGRKEAEEYKRRYLLAIENQLGFAGLELYYFVEELDAQFISDNSMMNPKLSIELPYGEEEAELIAEQALEEWTFLAKPSGE